MKPLILTGLLSIILLSCDLKQNSYQTENNPADRENIRIEYYDNGNIRTKIPLRNKLKHGEAIKYYRNGHVQFRINYQDGEKHGTSTQYYKDGKIYQVTEYVEGKIEGMRKKFHANGKLMAEIPYYRDEACVGTKEYLTDGSPRKDYPTLHISKQLDEGMIDIIAEIKGEGRKFEFYKQQPVGEGCFRRDGSIKIANMTEKSARLSYMDGEGKPEYIHIMAKVITRQGNPYWLYEKVDI